MSAFPKDAAPTATKVGLPGTTEPFDPHLREVGPVGYRSLDAHVVRQMLGASFWSMRDGPNESLAKGISAQLGAGDGARVQQICAEAEKVLDLVRDGGDFLALFSAKLPVWHQRLTSHETGRGTTCLPELEALGKSPEICLTEVRGLREALEQLGSGRNPGFDQGVSAGAKAMKGFGISSFRKLGSLFEHVNRAAETNPGLKQLKLLLTGLAAKEPTSAAEAAVYLQNLRANEATIRGTLPRDQGPVAPPSAQQVQSEAMKVSGDWWRSLFTPRVEEVRSISGYQRLALGYTFFATCLNQCVEGRAAAAQFATLIRASDQPMLREAIGVLEARQLCPTVEVRKAVEPLLAPLTTPSARTWAGVNAIPAAGPKIAAAPVSTVPPIASAPVVKPDPSPAPATPTSGKLNVEVAATPAPGGAGLNLTEPKVAAAKPIPRTFEQGPTTTGTSPHVNLAHDHRQHVETALMARFGTRDFASAVIGHNVALLSSAKKLDAYLGVLDRTRPIWEPMIERGVVRPQDVSTVGLLDNMEFYAMLSDRVGAPLMREVMRANPSFREARQARAEYLTLLDETRSVWVGKLEGRISTLVVTRSGLELLQFEAELAKRFGEDSVFHAASRRAGLLNAPERREALAIIDAHLPLFKKVAAFQPPIANLLMTPAGLESLAEEHRDVVALDEIRKALLKDGFPFDIVMPVLRYGLLENDGRNYALARVGEPRLFANLKNRIKNYSEVEPLLREAVEHLASSGVRAIVSGKGGYGLNQYKSGDLAPRYPSLVRLIEWIREHPPGTALREAVAIPAAFIPTAEQPTQVSYPVLQQTQSKRLVENLCAAMRAIKPEAALPATLGPSVTALGEMAAFLQATDAKRGVEELIRCYSAIRSCSDDTVKQHVLTAIELASTKSAEGANTLVALTKSPDVLVRRISAGILMQSTPALVDAAKAGRLPKGEDVVLAVFDYIEAEGDKQFKQGAAENFMSVLQAHTPSWDVVYELRDKHRLGNIFVEALVEGFHD